MEANTPRYVPNNFEGSFTFMGISFKWINLIEGAVIALIAGFAVFEVIYDLLMIDSFQIIVVFVGVAAAMGLFVGLRGINHDHVYKYVYHMFLQAFRRRKMMYNPRVKYETIYLETYAKTQQSEVLSEEEYTSVANRLLGKIRSGHSSQTVDHNASVGETKEYNEENVRNIFEDDIGVIKETPKELLSKKKKSKKRKETGVNDKEKFSREKRHFRK